MGLLDDAIREHLELKKRRGADPSEIARQEQEALGPPRRAEFADEPAAYAASAAPEPMAEDDEEVLEPVREDDEELLDEEGAWLDDEPAPLPVDQPTQAFVPPDVIEDEPEERAPREPAEPPRGDQDVLGETPDFLQETPEHDRLWFEQKPPRDFDFDD